MELLSLAKNLNSLKVLDLEDNDLKKLNEVLEALKPLDKLRALILEGNPCSVGKLSIECKENCCIDEWETSKWTSYEFYGELLAEGKTKFRAENFHSKFPSSFCADLSGLQVGVAGDIPEINLSR